MNIFHANLNALSYKAESWILVLDETDLRTANNPPPVEIQDNYLQIPETVPGRVLNLAESVTASANTPYEKAQAIEAYLRQFSYSLELPEPPADRDIVDYFLFELQKGYCDYYASAMVILARAAGLPARLAIGYATGSYDYAQSLFVVTEANAHAWPEIFIEPFGWVPFEPTASLTTFDWTSATGSPIPLPGMTTSKDPDAEEIPGWLNILGLGLLAFFALAVGAFWYWLLHRKQRSHSPAFHITNLYQKMRAYFGSWILPQSKAMTPIEYQNELASLLHRRSASSKFKYFAHPITTDLQLLTDTYQQGVYSPRPLSPLQIKKARQSWRNILWRTIIFRIIFQSTH